MNVAGMGSFLPAVAKMAALAAAYFLTGKLGLLLAIPPGYATAVWPPSGIALAAMLVLGYRVWPGILLGSFLVNIGVTFDASTPATLLHSLVVAAGIGTGAALQGLAGAWLIRRVVGFPSPLDNEGEVARFLALGGPVACLVNATWSVTALFLLGRISAENYLFTWWTWWIGDTIGVLTITPLLLIWSLSEPLVWRRRRTTMTLPLVLTFALAVAFFVQASSWEQERVRRDFFRLADGIATVLKGEVDTYLEVLASVQDFHGASPDFTGQDFRAFVDRPLARHRGILALSWNPRVTDAERASYEARQRQEGFADFRFVERDSRGRLVTASRRPEYLPVAYIEPLSANRQALGYDVASDAVRNAALQRARESGKAAATARLQLVQTDGEPGLLVFQPVFRRGPPGDTPQGRRNSLQGYVVGVFRVPDLIAAAIAGIGAGEVEIELTDESAAAGDRILYASIAGGGGPTVTDRDRAAAFVHIAAIDVAGRQWQLRVAPSAAYLEQHRSWQAWSFLVAGLLFTSLLGAFLLVITGRAGRVEMLVDSRTRELAATNRQLREEVALREQSAALLQEKNVELARAIEAKDRFLATMSHELRTPLNAIIGFTGTLLMELAGPLTRDQGKQLQTIEGSARHLLALINDLLDLAKIESGKVEVSLEPTSCTGVVAEVATILRPLADKKGIQLAVVAPAADIVLETDRRALSQIVINLVNNAIKFTDRGQVTVELAQHDDGGRLLTAIRVSDTGCGIRAEDQSRLFQAFTQVDSSSTRRHEGTGLGLYLSRRLAELLGGRISCHSRPGEGSVFTLEIASLPGTA